MSKNISCNIMFTLLVAMAMVFGCSKPKLIGLVPAQGVITYQGEPLEGATICFTPKEFKSGARLGTGISDVQGRFTLRTIGEVGILPDDYAVIVVKNEAQSQQHASNGKTATSPPQRPMLTKVRSVIPKNYSDYKTSGLGFSIGDKGNRDLRIDLHD
ncbi:MAG: hypothetical protein ACRC46_09265 [Thermoguttaceae bacterium]